MWQLMVVLGICSWADARFRNIAKFNTAQLEETLTEAKNIDLNNYTQESIESLENAINVAKEAFKFS